MGYVSDQPPESIIIQRIQEFAMSRRDHEQYYTIDWKYQAKDRTLPSWPETREDMQSRLERTISHVIDTYTDSNNTKYKDHDLSIIFVTHASPVNGKV
jgi:broad specificity phosphatase PhoE